MGKRELVALLGLSSWGLVMVVWLFLAVPLVCLRFVIVVFPDHTHLLFLRYDAYLVLSLWSMDRLRNRQNITGIKHMYNEAIIQPPETYRTIHRLGPACGVRVISPTFRGKVC